MSKKSIDPVLLSVTAALVLLGTLTLFSASPTLGLKYGDPLYFMKRQIVFLLAGCGFLVWGIRISLPTLQKWFLLWFGLACVSLVLLFVPHVGQSVGGAVRWINLGFVSFQPSEIVKVALIIFLAGYLSLSEKKGIHFIRDIAIPLGAIGFLGFLLLLQPDLGTALVVGLSGLSILWVAGFPKRLMAFIFGTGVLGILGLAIIAPYRMRRLEAFVNPWKDPQGVGFHIIQSLLAVGSGGLWGLGIGNSRQKFFYIPQHATDFIYAILSEEMGFMGSVAVILLFVVLVGRGLRIARLAENTFSRLLATGLTAFLATQAFMNMGVVVGLLPTTGIPLPFVSYGGTALIINLFSIGLLLNISRNMARN